MGFSEFLDGAKTAVLPPIGWFDLTRGDQPIEPAIILYGVYDAALPGLDGTPVLYAATFQVSQLAIKERIQVHVFPDRSLGPALDQSSPRLERVVEPTRAGIWPITRVQAEPDVPLRTSYLNRPTPLSLLDLQSADVPGILEQLGYLATTDSIVITATQHGERQQYRTSVRLMLDFYAQYAQEMAQEFDEGARNKETIPGEFLDGRMFRRDGFAPWDEYTQRLLQDSDEGALDDPEEESDE